MAGEETTIDADTQTLLVKRFRCVAFAALGAGVDRAELDAALDVAVAAEERRQAAEQTAPRSRWLRPVPSI